MRRIIKLSLMWPKEKNEKDKSFISNSFLLSHKKSKTTAYLQNEMSVFGYSRCLSPTISTDMDVSRGGSYQYYYQLWSIKFLVNVFKIVCYG